MCGICGILDPAGELGPEGSSLIGRMVDRLRHRGPDAEGIWQEPGAALGHRRLAVIDLSGSRQPMEDPTGRFVMIHNGEIYNYLELREELEDHGVEFRSSGDTEVLLQAFIRYGADCLERLNGMFAFAIWDRETRTLFAARDRLGVKPFYYGQGSLGLFVFASELQAFRGLPLDFSMDHGALEAYLRRGFIPSPATIFTAVRELRPAHFLRVDERGIEVRRYWTPPAPDPRLLHRCLDTLCEELRELVGSAVALRLRSDVPLGAFLSGGLDSSIIAMLMRRGGSTAVHTFSIGFEEESFDESGPARRTAEWLGTRHHESRVKLQASDLLLQLARHYGQPYGDSSAMPTWALCRETRKHVTVALSGDGADEVFGGYRRYMARRWLEAYRLVPEKVRTRCVAPLVNRLPEGTAYYDRSVVKKLKLFVGLDRRLMNDPLDIYPAYFAPGDLLRLLPGENASRIYGYDPWAQGEDAPYDLDFMMRADLFHYLPDDILTKVDRASMAQGLEVRSPFMDYRVVEFACRLPLRHKIRRCSSKYILRRAFAKDLPKTVIRRRKHGFAAPLGDWFLGPLGDLYDDLLSSVGTSAMVETKAARSLLDEHRRGRVDHGNRLWLLLFLHAWYQWWREG